MGKRSVLVRAAKGMTAVLIPQVQMTAEAAAVTGPSEATQAVVAVVLVVLGPQATGLRQPRRSMRAVAVAGDKAPTQQVVAEAAGTATVP